MNQSNYYPILIFVKNLILKHTQLPNKQATILLIKLVTQVFFISSHNSRVIKKIHFVLSLNLKKPKFYYFVRL